MRIVMVNKYARVTGGADKQCMSLADSLRHEGHEVAFLAMADQDNVETNGVFVPTVVTHETRDELSLRQRARVLRDALWNREAADAMRQLIRRFRPNLVHAHRLYPQLSASPIVMARRRGLPIVQTLHDYEFLSANPFDATGGVTDRLESRLAYRLLNTGTFLVRRRVHAPAIQEWIAVSEFVARAHLSRGIRATVIPNFADLDTGITSRPFEERDGLLFLGALSVEKGVLDVLEIARLLRDTRIVIAGRGPLVARVAREAQSLPNVEFRGHLDSNACVEAIQQARLVVIPSRWEEPGSLVALEAMACGTPVVAFRCGGLDEYVGQTGAGLTVDVDPCALATACRTLMADRELWQGCAAAGQRASRTRFSQEAHTKAVIAVYERALERTR